MNRQQKEVLIGSLKSDFSTFPAAFLVNVKGLSVSQMDNLRDKVYEQGGKIKVAKGRLMKRALVQAEKSPEFISQVREQLAVVFSPSDSPEVAKILLDFSQKQSNFKLVAGELKAEVLSSKDLIAFAKLPTKDVLRSIVCGTLLGTISAFARAIDLIAKQRSEQ